MALEIILKTVHFQKVPEKWWFSMCHTGSKEVTHISLQNEVSNINLKILLKWKLYHHICKRPYDPFAQMGLADHTSQNEKKHIWCQIMWIHAQRANFMSSLKLQNKNCDFFIRS